MKYHYKTPEEVRKEIQEYVKQNRTSPYNKTFFIVLLNILIIISVFIILEKTGILKKKFSLNKSIEEIESITYRIEDRKIILYFTVKKPILVSSLPSQNKNIFLIKEVKIYTNKDIISIKPEIPKTIVDKESNFINIPLKEPIQNIHKVEIYLDNKIYKIDSE